MLAQRRFDEAVAHFERMLGYAEEQRMLAFGASPTPSWPRPGSRSVRCGRALMRQLGAPSYEPELDRVAAALDA